MEETLVNVSSQTFRLLDIDQISKVFTMTPASLTWREHDSGERKTGPLHISPLPVKTLKEEKVGRISGSDLISLLDTGKLLAVDTRPVEEWKMGSLNHRYIWVRFCRTGKMLVLCPFFIFFEALL